MGQSSLWRGCGSVSSRLRQPVVKTRSSVGGTCRHVVLTICPAEDQLDPIVGTTTMDTRTNMHLEEDVIGSQVRIIEPGIEVDLHRYREPRVVILAPNWCLLVERKKREALLLVR
jgi:hypothetical protein